MNVLAKIVIPRTEMTMRHILLELEELSREDFYRMKAIKAKKKKKKKDVCEESGHTCPICAKKSDVRQQTFVEPEPKHKAVKPIQSKVKISEKVENIKQVPIRPLPPKPIEIIPLKPIDQVLSITDTNKGDNEIQLKSLLSSIMILSKELIDKGTDIEFEPFFKICSEAINKLQEALKLPEPVKEIDNKTLERLEHLKTHLKEVVEVTNEFREDAFLSPSIENFLQNCDDVCMKIDLYLHKDISKPLLSETKSQLEHLKQHIEEVEGITKEYETEGLLPPSVEDFLRSCEEIKSKIDYYTSDDVKPRPGLQLDTLKTHLSGLEELTRGIKKEGFVTPSIEHFLSSCEGFKSKIDSYKEQQKRRVDPAELQKLKKQIDDTINLTKEAKEEGLISSSIEDFIQSCHDVRRKLTPKEKDDKPDLINELRSNINEVMGSAGKYKECGLTSTSMEYFLDTCKHAQNKLDLYERYCCTDEDNVDDYSGVVPVCSGTCICGDLDNSPQEPCSRCEEMKREDQKDKEFNEPPPCDTCKGIPHVEPGDEQICKTCLNPPEVEEEIELVPYVSPEQSEEHICGFCKKVKEDEDDGCVCQKKPNKEQSKEGKEPCKKQPSKDTVVIPTAEPSEIDSSLGYFEKKTRRITKIKRTQNPDGTIREEKETIVVKKEKHDPTETYMDDDDEELDPCVSYDSLLAEDDNENYVALYTVGSPNALGFKLPLRHIKSDIVCRTVAREVLRNCKSMPLKYSNRSLSNSILITNPLRSYSSIQINANIVVGQSNKN